MSALRVNFDHSLGFVLNDISRLTRQEFDRRVRRFALTRAQWLFLFYAARHPGCTQSELAESMQQVKITVSRQADRLEKAGWIERRDHATDRRAYHLHLRPKAERMVRKLAGMAEALRSDYLRAVPPERRATLMDDLLLIKLRLQQMAAEGKKSSS
jgi:DNA-binding MarR family transcriptional regulator